jgi:multicomponent K+:H+ antiporter subunit D
LFQLQIAGLNGAFLTGDVFNLFVFFEVLLLASYTLLLHGGGGARSRAGVAYVVLNLSGSALFLVALALLYATLGTLNLADMGQVLPQLTADSVALARTAGALLLVVFALKAALVPLGFWLPHAYAAAGVPAAALFAIMTKLGIYAVLRVTATGLAAAPGTVDLLQPWLAPLAVATIALGTLGVLAAQRLGVLVANVVLISTATILAVVADGEAGSGAAALYYLGQSVLVTGALFLLAGLIGEGRGDLHDRIERGPRLRDARWLGWTFFVLAIAASGVPPLSGFIGKLMMLASVPLTLTGATVWTAILLSSFLTALALARAASTLFWESRTEPIATATPIRIDVRHVALALILGAGLLFVPAAAQISAYADATAHQLYARQAYTAAVLGPRPDIVREPRP